MSDIDGENPKPSANLKAKANPETTAIVNAPDDRYECRACGYTYEPDRGDPKNGIAANTAFDDLPITWKCPVCGAQKKAFSNIGPKGSASGFKENLGYGLGVNTLTPGQKNVLIFGAIGLAIVFFLSLYSLN
jgi:rubredoxin